MGSLADVYVSVRANMREFEPDFQAGVRKVDGDGAGRKLGERFSSGFNERVKRIAVGSVARSMNDLGESTDDAASKASTATGAFGALGSGLELVGKENSTLAKALAGTGLAFDFLSGVTDLATLALKSSTLARIKDRVATIAQAAAQRAAAAAAKAWAVSQRILNVVMRANPIGLVITAVAALAGGLIYAYKRSETFRKVVNGAFKAVQDAGKFMWEKVLKPTFRFLVTAWLNVAGAILHGAATAFGWVPGLGPKLKGAAKEFDKLKKSINNSLAGVDDKAVTIAAKVVQSDAAYNRGIRSGVGRKATGGRITGPGTGTSDSIPAMLSNGEHVWTAREVAAAGGHAALERMRKAALAGRVRGDVADAAFATGGPVGLQPRAQTPSQKRLNSWRDDLAEKVVASQRRNLLAALAAGGLGGGALGGSGWRRQWALVHQAFPAARLFSSYRPGARTVSGNRSYHALGRAIDVTPSMRIFDWIRSQFGRRTKELIYSPAGSRQLKNGSPHYYTGAVRAQHFNHVHWAYDNGGWLPTGLSLAYNGTGRPERVVGPGQDTAAGATLVLNNPTILTRAQNGAELVKELRAYESRNGKRWRS